MHKTEHERQEEIIKELRRINDEEFARTGRRKKHVISTYGCQMNSVGCIFISH